MDKFKCPHCRDEFEEYYCDICSDYIDTECKACHAELKHGAVPKLGSVKFVGQRGKYKEDDLQYFPWY